MDTPIYIPMAVAVDAAAIRMSVAADSAALEMKASVRVASSAYAEYAGPTDVTPNGEAQVLLTSGKVVPANIVIQPIPSNYGKITWNGSALTVS